MHNAKLALNQLMGESGAYNTRFNVSLLISIKMQKSKVIVLIVLY